MKQIDTDLPSSADTEGPPLKGWRRAISRQHVGVVPAWKSRTAQLPGQLLDRQRFRRLLTIVGCFGLAGLLFGFLVWDLVFYPRMVPFIALSVTEYQPPLPPHGWAREDLDQIQNSSTGLHLKTLMVQDLSLQMRTRERAKQALTNALKDGRSNAIHSGALMVYISMHGFVDDQNQVGLLLPDSDPVRSDTWWKLQEIFESIRELRLPDETLKLVILDCNRELSYWPAGVVCNHLASRLESEIARANLANLVVLNSTGPGERGWQSRDMHGSVFAQYLRVGLAGAADRRSKGNRNRQITLHELHEYLQDSVDGWAWQHRRSRQRPQLYPRGTPNRNLTWTLGHSEVNAIIAEAETQATPVPMVSIEAISRLWFDFGLLQKSGRFRTDPMLEAKLGHQLLWLERALISGSAYANPAVDMQRTLAAELASLQQQSDASAQAIQDLNSNKLVLPDQLPHGVAFDSIPLGERFQSINNNLSGLVSSELQQVIATPSLQSIQAAITRISAEPRAVNLSELHFLKLLSQYVPALGSRSLEQVPDLLKLEILANRVAVPHDERQSRWLKVQIDAGDQQRRLAFDAWTTGKPTQAAILAANRYYAAAQRLSQDLTRAMILRDRVMAELPYLAEWISRPTWPVRRAAEQAQLVEESLPQVVTCLVNLNAALNHVVTDDDLPRLMESSPFQSQVDELEDKYGQLRSLIDEEYERLLASGNTDAAALSDMVDLLEQPLLSRKDSNSGMAPFAQRTSLQSLSLIISTELQSHAPPFGPVADIPNVPDATVAGQTTAAGWNSHPILMVLQPARADVETSTGPIEVRTEDRLTNVGRQVRRLLAEIPKRLDVNDRAAHDLPTNPRSMMALNSCLQRTVAPLLSRPPASNPIAVTQLFDLRQFLLDAAARRLDDFWGLAGTTSRPYFSSAALTDLTLARQMFEPGPFAQDRFSGLRQRLNNQTLAAGGGLQISATDVLLIESLTTIPASMKVTPAVGVPVNAFPPGTALALLRPGDSSVPVIQQSFPVPFSKEVSASAPLELSFSLTPDAMKRTEPQWEAVVSYRGHEFPSSFLAHLPQGAVTDFQPAHPAQASVMISGGPLKRDSIVFILDCSHSMSKPSVAESPSTPPSRMAAATKALQAMLSRLAERKDVQVGVQFFGHRVGWNTKQPSQLLPQTSYGRPIPPGLQPYEDVEVILPLGRFDPSWEQSIMNLLKTVQPWGESPLYLSIIRSLPLFLSNDQQEAQTIVVITDGVNNQFNPSSAARKDLQDVITALQGKSISVHIVGFGIEDKDETVAQHEFGTLAKLTHGSYTTVDKASALVESLEKILAVQQFTVRPVAGATVTSDAGQPVVILGPYPPAKQVTASLGGASLPLLLEGGEAVELLPTADGQKLLSTTYEHELISQVPLIQTGANSTMTLGVHRATRTDAGVLFEFSLQDSQRNYLPRPDAFWLTITPGPPGNAGVNVPYVFYDSEFVPNLPVPVVRWLANDFPVNLQQAQVQCWVREELPPPMARYDLKSDLTNCIQNGASVPLPSLPDVRVDIRVRPGTTDRIDIVERHPNNATPDKLLYVTLKTDRTIQRVIRRFDMTQDVAVHMFILSNDPRNVSDRLSGTSIEIRTHDSLAKDSRKLASPVSVDISTDHGLVRPTLLPPDTP